MAERQRRTPHTGFWTRAMAVGFAVVVGGSVLATSVDALEPCDNTDRYSRLMGCGDPDNPRPPPPPPPPPPPDPVVTTAAWNRIIDANATIQIALGAAERLDALSKALNIEIDQVYGVDYVRRENGEGLLDSLAEFEKLAQESRAWLLSGRPQTLGDRIGGDLTGILSLRVRLGGMPRNGPEWGEWQADLAEGVAEIAARKIEDFQSRIVEALVYHDGNLDRQRSLSETARRLATEAVGGSLAPRAFFDHATREINDQIRAIRAGAFGGQQGPRPPTPVDDAFVVDPLTPIVLTAAQLLDNDSDPNGDSFTIVAAWTIPAAGTVELVQTSPGSNGGSDQVVVYTPNEDLDWEDWGGAFSYRIRDSRGQQGVANVRLTLSRRPPVAHDDTILILPRNSTVIPVADLLANDEAQDGRALTINRVSDSRGGAAIFNGSTVTWHTNDDADGGSFTYHVWDALGAGVSGTVTLVPDIRLALELNTAPEAEDDLVTYPTGLDALTIPASELLANDHDPERHPIVLTYDSSKPAVNGTVSAVYGNGYASVITFVLDDDSSSGSFRYTTIDTLGGSDIATVTVERYDRPPLTNPDLLTVDPDQAAGALFGSIRYADVTIPAVDLLENDRDPEGLPLRLVAVEDPRNGTVRIDGDSVVFTPDGGGADPVIITNRQVPDQPPEQPPEETYGIHGGSFAYLAEDPYGNRAREWVNLSVMSGPPAAADDRLSGFVNAPTPIPPERLLRNDNHPNGRRMTLEQVRDPVNGRAVYAPDGVIRFTPEPDFAAEGGGFTYQIADGVGGRATAVVHLTPGNALPEPVDDNMAVSRSEPTAIDVGTLLENDVEPDGEALRVVAIENTRGGEFTLEYPDSGALTLRAENDSQTLVEVFEFPDGAYRPRGLRATGGNLVRFQPGPDFAETGARFDYVVMDDRYGRTTATVLLSAGNEVPVGEPDLIVRPRADRYEIAAGDLTANDTDADGDPISIRSVASGRDGVASLSSDGQTVIFEPATASANGVFSYVVVDPMGGEGVSTVVVEQAVGVPEAVNDVVDVTGEGPWRILIADLMANDRDPAGDGLTFGGVVETGAAGQASFDGVSAFVLYEPEDMDGAGGGNAAACRDPAPIFSFEQILEERIGANIDITTCIEFSSEINNTIPNDFSSESESELANRLSPAQIDIASCLKKLEIADQNTISPAASCPASASSAAHTFRYRINTVRGSAVGAVTLRPARDRPAPEAVDDRVEVVFSDANEAFIPVSRLLANDSLPAGDAAALSVVDVFDTEGVYGYLSDDGETVVLGAAPTFATNAEASADRIGGGFRYRVGDGRGGFATAQVTLMAAPEVGVPVMVAAPPPDDAEEPEMKVDDTRFDVELIQAVLVSGDAAPFLPQNPLSGTPLGTDAGSTDYSGTYAVTCVLVGNDDASLDADFHLAGSHPLTVAQAAGTLSLTSDTPLLSIAGPFPNPPAFVLSGAVSDGFGGTFRSSVTGRFVEPDQVSLLYQLSYPGSPSFTSDFQCEGRR